MWAITPKGIGKEVGARAIKEGWTLAPGETFTVAAFTPGMVLAADGQSLDAAPQAVPPTLQELSAFAGEQLNTPFNKSLFEAVSSIYVPAVASAAIPAIAYENPPGTPILVTTKNQFKNWWIWKLAGFLGS